jgi:large subunit ribosomal protein L13
LQGKDAPDYAPNKVADVKVIVENVSKMKFTGKKFYQKVYQYHTGYIGHLKEKKLKEVFEKNPTEVLRKAVLGMLPKNSLRSKRIKNLKMYA